MKICKTLYNRTATLLTWAAVAGGSIVAQEGASVDDNRTAGTDVAAAAGGQRQDDESRKPIETAELIESAEMHARLAAVGGGDVEAFVELQKQIDKVPRSHALESHRGKISEWQKIYKRAFVERFPLVRGLPQFRDNAGEFHLFVRHDQIAVRHALNRLKTELEAATKEEPLRHHARVVLLPVAFDNAPDAEQPKVRETARRELFRSFLHLSPMTHDDPSWSSPASGYPDAGTDEKQLRAVLGKWSHLNNQDEILLVFVRRTSLHDDRDVAFVAEGRLYRNGDFATPASTRAGVGIVRKQYDALLPAAGWFAICFIFAVLLSPVLKRRKRISLCFSGRMLRGAVLAFGLGTTTTCTVVALLGRVAPNLIHDAIAGLWWPCLFGALLLAVPALAWCLIRVKSLASILPVPLDGRIGSCSGLGVSAAMGLPVLSSGPYSVWPTLIAVAVAATLISGLIGLGIRARAVRRPLLLIGALTLACVWGLGLGMLHPYVLLSTIGAATLMVMVTDRSKREDDVARDERSATQTLSNELPFQPPAGFENLAARIGQTWHDGHSCWLRVGGPPDCGKTTMSNVVVDRLLADSSEDVKVIRVTCQADDSPLEPFLRTAEQWGSELLTDAAGIHFFNSTRELVATLAPTLDELIGASPEEKSPADWLPLIESELGGVSETQRLILVVDDAQWIDESSLELLRRLRARFSAEHGPLVIVSGGKTDLSAELFDETFELEAPTDEHLTAILLQGLRFDERSARRVIETIDAGSRGNRRGRNLTWLKRTVDHLAGIGATFQQDGRIFLSSKYLSGQLPPAPPGLQELVRKQIERFGPHRLLLQAAACIGSEFEVDALCECLARDRLSVLEALGELACRSDLIVEIGGTGRFAFASAQTYQTVCESVGIRAGLPEQPVSQLQSELHGRIAALLQRDSEQDVFNLARQCALAGGRFAVDGLHYCQQAAGVATATYAFDQAQLYLRWADRCANLCEQPFDLRLHQLLLDCERAYVTGEKRLLCEAADRAMVAASQYEEPTVLVAFARACYGAQKMTEGKPSQRYASEAMRIGMQVADADAATPAQRAAGLHFVALGQSPSQASRVRLRQARTLLLGSQNVADLITLAHIECSLANELLRGTDMQPDEARQLFEHSLSLHQEHKANDLAGIARLHGGLGRIALYIDGDVAQGRFHARENLNYCRQLGDRRGMAQMSSLLGDCALAEGDQVKAAAYFKQCMEYAQSRTDHFFAIIGLLRSAQGSSEEMHRHGTMLLSLLRGDDGPAVTVPPFAKRQLSDALNISRRRAECSWADSIEAYLGDELVEPRRVPRKAA